MRDVTRYPIQPVIKLLALFLLIALCETHAAQAQRDASAYKSADLSVFGGYTYVDPDYSIFMNNGAVVGIDYTRYLHWRIVPSFEARVNYNTGKDITEESALGGLRLKMDLRRYHPYANALVGGTKITYKFPPSPRAVTDRTFTTSIGGGVDIDLVRSFQMKLDFQNQFENFGPNGTKPNNADFTLTPLFYTVGIVYRIP